MKNKRPTKEGFPSQKCAYHSKQAITNFCKCQECLLPVCPTCIKMHIDEHKVHKTTPQFEEINKVVQEILNTYTQLQNLADSNRKFLEDVEKAKKQNEQKIRSALMQNRKSLIKAFQGALIAVQDGIVQSIIREGQELVTSLSQLDEELEKIAEKIEQGRSGLNSQQVLKSIIIYFGKKSQQKYKRQLEYIKGRIIGLTKKQLNVVIQQRQLDIICLAIEQYMKLQIIDDRENEHS